MPTAEIGPVNDPARRPGSRQFPQKAVDIHPHLYTARCTSGDSHRVHGSILTITHLTARETEASDNHISSLLRPLSLLSPLPGEDKCEQDDVRSESHDPQDLQAHVAGFPEEAASSLAVGFSDRHVAF